MAVGGQLSAVPFDLDNALFDRDRAFSGVMGLNRSAPATFFKVALVQRQQAPC
jgi:hypothetical protein